MPKRFIPSNLIRPYIQDWIDNYETYAIRGDYWRPVSYNSWEVSTGGRPPLSPRTILCERADVSLHTLGHILSDDPRNIEFDTVDRLMSKTWNQDWGSYPELREFYWEGAEIPPMDENGMMFKPFKCQNPECSEWYEVEPDKLGRQDPARRRYCSRECAHRVRTVADFKRRNPRRKKCAFSECGKMFSPIRSSMKYCDRKCAQLHRNRKRGIQSFAERYAKA